MTDRDEARRLTDGIEAVCVAFEEGEERLVLYLALRELINRPVLVPMPGRAS
jgi:hypothetical protein